MVMALKPEQHMILDEGKTKQRAELFRVLSDATRLQILALLLSHGGTLCVIQITDRFPKTQPTISNHLGQLRRAGLIDYRRTGLENYYYVRPEHEAEICGYLGGL